jgi:biotin carboxylase
VISSIEKGHDFLRSAKRCGWKVVLITSESIKDKARWPVECIDEIFYMHDDHEHWDTLESLKAVMFLARTRVFDRIVPLDDLDLELAALLREHLHMPGLGETATRFFRDKLFMRAEARAAGFLVPDFVQLNNDAAIDRFADSTPPPWLVKPRFLAGAMGIKKASNKDELWRIVDRLGDERSFFLAEGFVPGEIFHVDSLIRQDEVIFSRASAYGKPPLAVASEGDVFSSRLLPKASDDTRRLVDLNRKVLAAFNFHGGVTHSEFIRGAADGKLYFLETAARVAGAYLADMIEAATGVNLWAEWARLELADSAADYELPEQRDEHAGIVLALAKAEHPDINAYQDPEIVWRLDLAFHIGFIVRHESAKRVEEVMASLADRIRREHLTWAPPRER